MLSDSISQRDVLTICGVERRNLDFGQGGKTAPDQISRQILGAEMPSSISRRDLFNRINGVAPAVRPPWTRPEAEFTELCSRCDDCIRACPENILKRGSGGFPIADFSASGCTFCGDCAEVCEAGAFVASRDQAAPWPVAAKITAGCLEHRGISCRACESWCEPRAIRFRPALGGRTDIRIETENCTGCGQCVAPCPQDAISIAAPDTEGVAA